jgi:hypothetical protein
VFVLTVLLVFLLASSGAEAQPVTQRGFVDVRATAFPQEAPRDPRNLTGDFLLRQEIFAAPATWLRLAGGVDLRAGSHGEVDHELRLDITDRTRRRPLLSIRRLTATVRRGPLTLDAGKQFIRWGKTDIVAPTDRFAPRDYLNVVESEFLAVRAVRAMLFTTTDSLDLVWAPFFTPSRLPLIDRRWSIAPADAPLPIVLVEDGQGPPDRGQAGIRWNRTGSALEWSVSFFNGFNHLPVLEALPPRPGGPAQVELATSFTRLRMYGGDAALPTRWFTVKAEAGYFTTPDSNADEYVLYVVQLERQTGEWLLIGGYAGEAVTSAAAGQTFAPDRGTARSLLGRASYTIDAARSVAFEGAWRQSGAGAYAKAEFSEARGDHWRWTVSGALLAGRDDDFIGRYRRNSHVTGALRYSY